MPYEVLQIHNLSKCGLDVTTEQTNWGTGRMSDSMFHQGAGDMCVGR